MLTKCKLCGHSVWVGSNSTTGNLVVLDANPSMDGEYWRIEGQCYFQPLNEHRAMLDLPMYRHHADTCKGKTK